MIFVVSLNSWALDKVSPDIDQLFFPVETAEEAAAKACELAEKRQALKIFFGIIVKFYSL